MAVCSRRGDVDRLSAQQFLMLSQGRRCPALESHHGSGKVGKTLWVRLIEVKVAWIVLRALHNDGRGCGCCTVGYFPFLQTPSTEGR